MSTTLTTGRPWRVILAFAVPLLIGNVVQQMYQFADAIVVGRHLGVDALAAVGATGSLIFLLLGFAWGLGSGFAIPTAQAFGGSDFAAVRRSVATGTILTGLSAVIITVVGPLVARPLLVLMQTPPVLLDQATVFTQVTFIGGSTVMFFNYLSAVIRAIGDSRTPLVFLTVSCALNIALVILMVGVFEWGVGGAALATVVAQAVSVGLCLVYVWRKVPVLHVRRADWRVSRADFAEHLRLGLPMGFQASIISIGMLVVQVTLNTIGPDAVAAYTTASRVDSLAVAFLASLGLATSMYTAQNLGGRRPDRIRRGVSEALAMGVITALVLGALLVLFGSAMVRVFIGSGSDEVVRLAALMLLINGCSYLALSVLFILRGVLQGLGHALIPTITGVIELVMRIGAAVVLGALIGYPGVVLSNPLAWVGACVLLIPAYRKAYRELARMPVNPAEVTETTAMAVIGPSTGSMAVMEIITTPIRVVPAKSRIAAKARALVGRR
jgi:putative MATE family efflux protein